jgi:hypothetical protein
MQKYARWLCLSRLLCFRFFVFLILTLFVIVILSFDSFVSIRRNTTKIAKKDGCHEINMHNQKNSDYKYNIIALETKSIYLFLSRINFFHSLSTPQYGLFCYNAKSITNIKLDTALFSSLVTWLKQLVVKFHLMPSTFRFIFRLLRFFLFRLFHSQHM